ncbi:MAG: hypothetical protein ABSC48_18190 [Terracidiphilus sp.]|jgi:hypothetical protein
MNEPPHPSSLGEILDRTAQLYRSRFLVFLGISILPTAVMVALGCVTGLVAAWWSRSGASSVPTAEGYFLVGIFAVGGALVALPSYVAAAALASAAMSHAVSRVYFGESTTIRNVYKDVWRRGWRYIGLYLLRVLFIWVAPFVVWIAVVFLSAAAAALAQKAGMGNVADGFVFGLAMVLILIALAGYILWMLIELSLAFPACVVEQMRVWASVKRSFALCKGTRGRIFVLGLLGAMLSWLLSVGGTFFLMILFFMIPGMTSQKHQQTATIVMMLILYGCSFAVQALIRPVYGIALVLFYYDQRIRQEGFDIEWMMEQAGMVAAPPATAQAPVPVPEAAQEPLPWLPAALRLTHAPEDESDSLQTGVEE